MNKWKYKKKAVASVLIGIAVAFPSYTGHTTGTINVEEPTVDESLQQEYNQAKEDLGEMTSELENTQKLLEELKQKELDMQSYVQQLDNSMTEIANKISDLTGQIEEKELEIQAVEGQLQEAEKKEEEQYNQMKLRIQYMYEQGESDYLEILFQATSFPDILNRMEYISKLVDYDRKMLEEYNETVQLVKTTKETLDNEKQELIALKADEEEKQAAQQLLIQAKQEELSTIQANVSTQQDQVTEIENRVSEQQQLTIELEQDLQKQAEEAKKLADQLLAQAAKELQEQIAAQAAKEESIRQSSIAAEEESRKQSSIAQSIADSNNTDSAAENEENEDTTVASNTTTAPTTTTSTTTAPSTGNSESSVSSSNQIIVENGLVTKLNLKWPVPSSKRITSHFGPRPNKPVEGANPFHYGTDVGAAMGADIVAAADGIVVYVGDGVDIGNQGCGNQIWIANGNGEILTMYNHCSVLKVTKGQYVKAGEVIGLIGSTGYSTGPHLDFRIYITGAYARYDKTGEYLDALTGEYINPSDSTGTRKASVSISYY